MTDLPLRSISISDFRRLAGHRTLPLDAPIVLVHGANGTGKTSILAALEMGLTGQIRSMRRQDLRYTAYLPHLGQDFATIRVTLAEQYAAAREAGPVTVGGSRIEGTPALARHAAAFFAERCYLDQVSLGQLLELYQYREGKEESALARFVNELLGLEQLDALRAGLHDSNDFRRLKNLSPTLDDATDAADHAGDALTRQTEALQETGAELSQARHALLQAITALELEPPADDEALLQVIMTGLQGRRLDDERVTAAQFRQALLALGGRVSAIIERQATARLQAARQQLAAAETALKDWQTSDEPSVLAVQQEIAALRPTAEGDWATRVEDELRTTERAIERQGSLQAELSQVQDRDAANASRLTELTSQLAAEQEQAGALVEGLAAIRTALPNDSDVCPVCDRDFSEVSTTHLGAHIEQKLAQLTSQGERLTNLRRRRDALATTQFTNRQTLARLKAEVLTSQQNQELDNRRAKLIELRGRLQQLEPSTASGRELASDHREAEALVQTLEESSKEIAFVDAELVRIAALLNVPITDSDSLEARLTTLSDIANRRLGEIDARIVLERDVREASEQYQRLQRRLLLATQDVAEAAQKKQYWEVRIVEARRRQRVARDVHHAAGVARTEVVQHVFTESLNQVWRSVFTRLAPREHYIPAFGIPTSTKAALELTLKTTHVSGEEGGPPQMMLSAGNLNTAALSLFLALHLAVEPIIPCLVFDDPVQAMDEVHVAQFAALIRILSKHHDRQVVIAVHERELFEYLALELSPAYPGDELITIELTDQALGETERVTRRTWAPDLAIAT